MSSAGLAARQRRARPAGARDRNLRRLAILLPIAIAALVAILVIAPLLLRKEVSFVLAKDKVPVARERMRIAEALYRGADDKGRPFSLHAGNAVQATSKEQVVRLQDLSARLTLDRGPAVLRAPVAQYDLDGRKVRVDGPLLFESADGYRLTTRDVGVDLGTRTIASDRPVEGRMPLGTFSGDRLRANLDTRTVSLEGRARLHIVQGGARGR